MLPELLHNVQLLVDRTESEILQNDRRLQYNEDLIVNLRHEREGLQDEIEVEETQISKLTEILNTVEMYVCIILSISTVVMNSWPLSLCGCLVSIVTFLSVQVSILSTLSSCEQRLSSSGAPPLTLQDCQELMASLQEKYPHEYKVSCYSQSMCVCVVFVCLFVC